MSFGLLKRTDNFTDYIHQFQPFIIKKLYPDYINDTFQPNLPLEPLDAWACNDTRELSISKNVNKFFINRCEVSLNPIALERFQTIYYNIHRVHAAFKKIGIIFQFNKSTVYNTHTLMTELIPEEITSMATSKNTHIVIYENKMRYIFSMYEIIHHINSCLSHHDHYFVESKKITNPYTNLPLHFSSIYNIYFKMLKHLSSIPILFHLFYKSNCCINTFKLVYISDIRDYIIFQKCSTFTNKELCKTAEYMLEDHTDYELHDDLDRSVLIYFKHLVYCYMYTKYGLNVDKKQHMSRIMKSQLRKFEKKNPCFGRKVYKSKMDKQYFKPEYGTKRKPYYIVSIINKIETRYI